MTDPHTRESRGFGFVTMETNEGAERCIKYLNRSVFEGRLITVEKVYFPSTDLDHCCIMRVSHLFIIFLSTFSSKMLPDKLWKQVGLCSSIEITI